MSSSIKNMRIVKLPYKGEETVFISTAVAQRIHLQQTKYPKKLLLLFVSYCYNDSIRGSFNERQAKDIFRLVKRFTCPYTKASWRAVVNELERLGLVRFNSTLSCWHVIDSDSPLLIGDVNTMMRTKLSIGRKTWTHILLSLCVASVVSNTRKFPSTHRYHVSYDVLAERMRSLFDQGVSTKTIARFKEESTLFNFARERVLNTPDTVRRPHGDIEDLPERFDGPASIRQFKNVSIARLTSTISGIRGGFHPGTYIVDDPNTFRSPRHRQDPNNPHVFHSLKEHYEQDYKERPYTLPGEYGDPIYGKHLFCELQVKAEDGRVVVFHRRPAASRDYQEILRDVIDLLRQVGGLIHPLPAVQDLALACWVTGTPEAARSISLDVPSKRKPVPSITKIKYHGEHGRFRLDGDGLPVLELTSGMEGRDIRSTLFGAVVDKIRPVPENNNQEANVFVKTKHEVANVRFVPHVDSPAGRKVTDNPVKSQVPRQLSLPFGNPRRSHYLDGFGG